MRPNEIFNILYSENIFGRSIFHAVLLQELLINVSVFMSTFPVRFYFQFFRFNCVFFLATLQWYSQITSWVRRFIIESYDNFV